MVSFNLLPDAKIKSIELRRKKRLVVLGSVAAIIVAAAIPVLMTLTYLGFKSAANSNANDIDELYKELTAAENIEQVLTSQRQLSEVVSLDDQRLVYDELFAELRDITTEDVSFSEIQVNYDESTVNFIGIASSYYELERFEKSLSRVYATFEPLSGEEDDYADFIFGSISVSSEKSSDNVEFEASVALNSLDIFEPGVLSLQVVPEGEQPKDQAAEDEPDSKPEEKIGEQSG